MQLFTLIIVEMLLWNSRKYHSLSYIIDKKRIPGSQFFNIDAIADAQLKLPHMLPTATFFKQCVEELGLNDSEEIVV